MDLRSRPRPLRAPDTVSFAALAIEVKRRMNAIPGVVPSNLFDTWIQLQAKEEKCRKAHQKQVQS